MDSYAPGLITPESMVREFGHLGAVSEMTGQPGWPGEPPENTQKLATRNRELCLECPDGEYDEGRVIDSDNEAIGRPGPRDGTRLVEICEAIEERYFRGARQVSDRSPPCGRACPEKETRRVQAVGGCPMGHF